jgi:D-inositol-3-phosphate glycosyltransferase
MNSKNSNLKPQTSNLKIALYNLTTTTKLGGVETFVWELGRELATRGHDVTIIGGRGPIRHRYPGVRVVTHRFISREAWRRIPLLGRQYGMTKLLERLSFAIFALPGLVRRRYDIIHIQKPYDLPPAALARWLSHARLVFGCHGKDFWPADRFFTRFVDTAVSCSHYNAATVQEHFHILPSVIYNGFDSDLFVPQPPDPQLIARYGDCIIFYLGRLVKWKGAQYAIEALALAGGLDDPLGAAHLVIGADGPYRNALEALAARLGIASRISFVGNIPHHEVPRYIASARVVVGASFANETFGMALCEASACARPVVASNFGGFPEVVQDGVTGLLYPPQDAAAFATALRRILADPAAAQQMGAAGRAYVLSHFTWAAVADRVLAAYASVEGFEIKDQGLRSKALSLHLWFYLEQR